MKAKEFLEQIVMLNKMIQNKIAEKEQWLAIATSATASSKTVMIGGRPHAMERVQSSGAQDKMADAVAKVVDIEAEIDEAINVLVDAKNDVIGVIEQLNVDEYDFLHKVYVQGFTLRRTAVMNNRSYSWATTLHKKALDNVQIILDERERANEGLYESDS